MNTITRHRVLAIIVIGLLITGCVSDESAGITLRPVENFTVTNLGGPVTPEDSVAMQHRGARMTLIGWAAHDLPIYARYGYSTDTTFAAKVFRTSDWLRTAPDANRPDVVLYAMRALPAE